MARVACILAFSSVRQFLGLLDMMSNLGRLATEPTDRMLLMLMLAVDAVKTEAFWDGVSMSCPKGDSEIVGGDAWLATAA